MHYFDFLCGVQYLLQSNRYIIAYQRIDYCIHRYILSSSIEININTSKLVFLIMLSLIVSFYVCTLYTIHHPLADFTVLLREGLKKQWKVWSVTKPPLPPPHARVGQSYEKNLWCIFLNINLSKSFDRF